MPRISTVRTLGDIFERGVFSQRKYFFLPTMDVGFGSGPFDSLEFVESSTHVWTCFAKNYSR